MPSALHLSQFNVGVCNAEVERRRGRKRRREGGEVASQGGGEADEEGSRGEKIDMRLPYGVA